MKYFKKYETYKIINEANDWSLSSSWIGQFFNSVGRFVNVNAKKIKLISLSREYDRYLDGIYKQYLIEKELQMSKNELGDIDINEITELISAAPVSKNKKSDDSGESYTQVEFKIDKKEIKEEIKDEQDDLKNDGDVVDKTPDVEEIDKNVNVKKTPTDPMQSKIRKIRIDGENVDVSDYNISRTKWSSLSKSEQDDVKHNILLHHYEKVAKKRATNDLKKIENKIEDLEERKREASRLRTNVSPGSDQRQKYQNSIDEISQELENAYSERRNIEKELKEAEKNLKDFYYHGIEKIIESLSLLKESKNFDNYDVIEYQWSETDKIAVTSMINPYTIEEIFLKADYTISGLTSEKTKKSKSKLKQMWGLRVNSVHKKWYYTFNIEDLRNKRKKIIQNNDNKKKREDTIKAKEALSISFQNQIVNYSSPDFSKIESEDSKYYFLSLGKSKIIFIEKVKFFENVEKYVFKLIGEISRSNNGDMYLKENYSNKFFNSIQYNNREIKLYKDEDGFPIVFFNKSYMYSFENINSKIENIDLVSFNLSALSNRLSNLVINHNKSFKFKTKNVEEKVLDKIKNEKL